jgi:hypothetical protein
MSKTASRRGRALGTDRPVPGLAEHGEVRIREILMYGSNTFLAGELMGFVPLHVTAMIGVLIYAAVLVVSGEVRREDFAIVFSRKLGQG